MRLYVAHFRQDADPEANRPPVMVKEGLSWPCLLLGSLGLLAGGAWIAALLAAAIMILAGIVLPHGVPLWPLLACWHLVLGLYGNEARAWELRLKGFVAGPVVAGPDAEGALLRLLDQRPERVGSRA